MSEQQKDQRIKELEHALFCIDEQAAYSLNHNAKPVTTLIKIREAVAASKEHSL